MRIINKHKTSVRKVLRQTKFKKELYNGVGKTLMNCGAEVLGVDAVVDNCNF